MARSQLDKWAKCCCDIQLWSSWRQPKFLNATQFAPHHFHTLLNLCFSDPDLAIEVDLKREEEERNGRRKFLPFQQNLCGCE